jgi:hypothetical protein
MDIRIEKAQNIPSKVNPKNTLGKVLGRLRLGRYSSRLAWELTSIKKSWIWWCMPIILTTAESIKQEDYGPGQPGQKARHYLQNMQNKRG